MSEIEARIELVPLETRFLNASLSFAREQAKLGQQPDREKTSQFVSQFMETWKGKDLFALRDLKKADLEKFLDANTEYLPFGKQISACIQGKLAHRAMSLYVSLNQDKYPIDEKQLVSSETGRPLWGAAKIAKKASLIREKQLEGQKEMPTIVALFRKQVDEQKESLKQEITTRITRVIPQKETRFDQFRKALHLLPRLPVIRRFKKWLNEEPLWWQWLKEPASMPRFLSSFSRWLDKPIRLPRALA